jgi:methylenetetrahydrofolate dehydrogenase (NADP+)/methenyltetrahydrofolate cyclohydrolase
MQQTDTAATAEIINGVKLAETIRDRIAAVTAQLKAERNIAPGLAVVQVGEVAASSVYVRNKVKTALAAGIASFEHHLPAETTQAGLLDLVRQLNNDPSVHGILVQLPLPDHMNASEVIETIAPEKDVDGFHPMNAGRLATGLPGFVPCTPLGSLALIHQVRRDLKGMHAVVIGRSNIVGKPMAHLLLAQDCTVTVAHSRTRDLPGVAAQADILVAAVGRPNMVQGSWVKPGAIVIDVGINRITVEGKGKLVGDVDFESARERAGAITPVPGGVGPMTVACLMVNTLKAAYMANGLDWTDDLVLAG